MIEGIIYKFTNKINGKVYIGQTTDEKLTYSEHKAMRPYKNRYSGYFHHAIHKYKFDKFKYEVLYRGDENTLDKKELYYINLYRSNIKKYGYNIEINYMW